jgi:hypothetical protein
MSWTHPVLAWLQYIFRRTIKKRVYVKLDIYVSILIVLYHYPL